MSVALCRLLLEKPDMLLLDEPTNYLDITSIRWIEGFLKTWPHELLLITHDLGVVSQVTQRTIVMYAGRVVESGRVREVLGRPGHPYTLALINSVPIPDPRLERNRKRDLLQGDLPSPLDPPTGCAFRTRCPRATDRCAAEQPQLRSLGNSLVACHHADQ